jgi:hypothetical protein
MSTGLTLIAQTALILGFYKLRSHSVLREYRKLRDGDDPLGRAYASRIAAVWQVTLALQTLGFAGIVLFVMVGVRLALFGTPIIIPLILGLIVVSWSWQTVRIKEVTNS